MKYLSNKNGFLGIDNKVNFKEKVVVVPFGVVMRNMLEIYNQNHQLSKNDLFFEFYSLDYIKYYNGNKICI